MEADLGLAARSVDARIRYRLNLQFVRRLHENQTMVSDGASVPAEEVGVDVHRSGQLRRGRER